MYVYNNVNSNLWTVGFYAPNGEWVSESDHTSHTQAADRVHWLNGGAIEPEPKKQMSIEEMQKEFTEIAKQLHPLLLKSLLYFAEYLIEDQNN